MTNKLQRGLFFCVGPRSRRPTNTWAWKSVTWEGHATHKRRRRAQEADHDTEGKDVDGRAWFQRRACRERRLLRCADRGGAKEKESKESHIHSRLYETASPRDFAMSVVVQLPGILFALFLFFFYIFFSSSPIWRASPLTFCIAILVSLTFLAHSISGGHQHKQIHWTSAVGCSNSSRAITVQWTIWDTLVLTRDSDCHHILNLALNLQQWKIPYLVQLCTLKKRERTKTSPIGKILPNSQSESLFQGNMSYAKGLNGSVERHLQVNQEIRPSFQKGETKISVL